MGLTIPSRSKGRLKRILFPTLFRLGVYKLLVRKYHRNKIVILCGHRVSGEAAWKEGVAPLSFETGVTRVRFEKVIRFIREEMHPVSLEQVVNFVVGRKRVPDRAVAVMLDDGYMDNYLNAFPILKRYAVPATIFLTTGYIGTDSIFWWDRIGEILKRTQVTKLKMDKIMHLLNGKGRRLPDVLHLHNLYLRSNAWRVLTTAVRPCEPRQITKIIEFMDDRLEVGSDAYKHLHLMLTWEQVQEMSRNGIDFGAHSVTHPLLSGVSPADFEREVQGSKKTMEGKIGKLVTAFAYPYGDLPNPRSVVKENLRSYGFKCAFLFQAGYISEASDPFELKRVGIGNVPLGMTVRELVQTLKGDTS